MDIISAEDIAFLSNQSTSRMNMVISGMTTLMNDIDGKVEMMESQNWFQKMINTLTGKNRVTRDEIKRNHDKLNAYMSEAISELYNQNCIDHQITISLGNQINELYADHLQLKRMLGEFAKKLNEKIESVDNFHMLMEEINQGMYENEKNKSIYSLVSVLAMMDKRILMDKRKCDIITHALRKQHILNSDIMTLEECLLQALDLNADEFGKFYMEVNSIHDHYFANMLVEAMQSKYFLPENQWNNVDKKEIVNRIIAREDFDPMSQVTTEDIFDDFFLAKQDLANGLLPFSAIQLDDKLKEAENLFLNCKFERAFMLFKTLAAKDIPRAMYFMGEFYSEEFLDIDIDRNEAKKWREKGKMRGDILSDINYGYSLYESDEINERSEYIKPRISNLINEAEKGDIFVQYELAYIYKMGHGIDKDIDKSIYYYKKSAEAGYWRSMCELGCLYYDEKEYLQQSMEEGIKWIKKAIDKGYGHALKLLGDIYYYGFGVEDDAAEAFKWYEEAANLGDKEAINELADTYFDEEDDDKAFKWNEKAAELGNENAMCKVASMYLYGCGTEKNYQEAFKWYKQAADLGSAVAMDLLGDMFCNTDEKILDYQEAFKWYEKAAELGNVDSMNSIASMYRYGNYVKQDYAEALKWYRKSSDLGSTKAMVEIAQLYYYGEGVEYDEQQGIEWYNKAVEKGDTNAMITLGDVYMSKLYWGSEEKAFQLYKKAVEKGDEYGMFKLGYCYYYGYGIEENKELAHKWLRKSAEAGYEEALDLLYKGFNEKID